MPRPMHRSRSLKRRQVNTPGGRLVTHYKKKISGWYKCAICKRPLFGVPKDPKNYSKSSRRPERAYGGVLCANCLRRLLVKTAIMRSAPNLA
ncbi:MAG: 50S ribosomal protein L34e [Candidatus Njordarchaeota archaeon]